jgi:hypothetical protein
MSNVLAHANDSKWKRLSADGNELLHQRKLEIKAEQCKALDGVAYIDWMDLNTVSWPRHAKEGEYMPA